MRSESEPWDGGRDEPGGDDWDARDARRQQDPMAPPMEPCECFCQHCHRTFMSDRMWLQRIKGHRDGFDGFWMCPTPNCGGSGFTFDIFPTDPNHPGNAGWCYFDDDDSDDEEIPWGDDDGDSDGDIFPSSQDSAAAPADYDPAEPQYKMMDDWCTDDDDLEGEEWKYGLEPGERLEPPKPDWLIEEEKKYDEPDRRPRELDASEMPEQAIGEDDIPF